MSGFGPEAGGNEPPMAEMNAYWQDAGMPRLLFEIWENPENRSFHMAPVTKRADELRRQTEPRSVVRHSFHAESDFEAYQMNYDWHGWGTWRSESNWTAQQFTADEVAAQEL